jgi:hypothetical protein
VVAAATVLEVGMPVVMVVLLTEVAAQSLTAAPTKVLEMVLEEMVPTKQQVPIGQALLHLNTAQVAAEVLLKMVILVQMLMVVLVEMEFKAIL